MQASKAALDSALIESAMRFVLVSALSTFTLTIWPALHRLGRVLDEAVRELADVHQPVLMHADVDERAELRHVGDHAFQHHPGCTSAILRTSSWKFGATNLSRGSRPGLRSSSRMSSSV